MLDEIVEEVTETVIEQIIQALTGEEVEVELGDDDEEEPLEEGGRTEELDDAEFGIE